MMNIGDKVTRKWKPELGMGIIKHLIGDKAVVAWYGKEMPVITFEEIKFLKAKDEGR